MKLIVNGRPHDTRAGVLEDLLTELGYGGTSVATALNGTFVPQDARATTSLGDGDRLEVLTPRQGG